MPIVLGFALSCVVLNLVPGPGMKFTIAQGGQARSSAVRQALRADRGASNGAAG
jgi:threonine/homoserine/homoserine lactone efflux protein